MLYSWYHFTIAHRFKYITWIEKTWDSVGRWRVGRREEILLELMETLWTNVMYHITNFSIYANLYSTSNETALSIRDFVLAKRKVFNQIKVCQSKSLMWYLDHIRGKTTENLLQFQIDRIIHCWLWLRNTLSIYTFTLLKSLERYEKKRNFFCSFCPSPSVCRAQQKPYWKWLNANFFELIRRFEMVIHIFNAIEIFVLNLLCVYIIVPHIVNHFQVWLQAKL